MSTLSADVQAAIQKNLPAEVADTLRGYLQECETLRKENEQLKKWNKEAHDQNAQYVDENLRLATELKQHEELAKREAAVLARENNLKVEVADLQRMSAEKRVDDIFRLTETVFRSPVVKRSVYQHDTTRDNWVNGYNQPVKTGSSSTEEVTEQ